MKLQVLQENLISAVSIATRFTSSKAQLPVLANLLLAADRNRLTISATNLEIAITIPVGAKVDTPGKITVPARVFQELIANLRKGTLQISSEKEIVEITQEVFKSKISAMNASDFPPIAQNRDSKNSFVFSKELLLDALSSVLFSTSFDETRPVLTGVLFAQAKEGLYLVSTDGFRLSKRSLGQNVEKEFAPLIVPRGVLGEIVRIPSDSSDVSLEYDKKEKQVVFGLGGTRVSSRLIEGDYPDFEKIIPKKQISLASVNKDDFIKAVKLAAVFARDAANVVSLKVKKNSLAVYSESQKSGVQENSIDSRVEGESVDISFNFHFLEDFLNSIKGESVVMEFNGSESAGVFKDPQDESFFHLIMPVRV